MPGRENTRVRLHKTTTGYRLAGADDLLILRPSDNDPTWRLFARAPQTRRWMRDQQLLNARFDTLRDARRTLQAHIATQSPPALTLAPAALARHADGSYSATGGYTITPRRSAIGDAWTLHHQDHAQRTVASLPDAQRIIARHRRQTTS